jgi:uncharacterized protein (DUF1015 family)
MAHIEPFAGIHYDPELVDDLTKVVCPPYDVINTTAQEGFYQKHSYNFIRLILGKEMAHDNDAENKYTRAAGYFEEWMRRGILRQDDAPSLYFYQQEFTVLGKMGKRFGFIALMGLGDEAGASATVYPHEHTHTAPKEDRLRVFKAVEANLSPIFTIFSDPQNEVKDLFLTQVKNRKPDYCALDADGGSNKVWRIVDAGFIGKVKKFIEKKELFIADGHHRFEVAKMFRDQKKATDPLHFKGSYNYIMTYFTALEDEGLVVLPTHRLIKGGPFDLTALKPIFEVVEKPGKKELVEVLEKNMGRAGSFGCYQAGRYFFFRVADKAACDKMIQEAPRAYKDLDVAILHKVVFDKIFQIALPQIAYEVDLDRAIAGVDVKSYGALFILNPTKVEQIRQIALGGEVMPQKSTYFYPKLLSGLVVHKF